MGCWAPLTAWRLLFLAMCIAAGACPAARAAGGLTLLTDQPLPMAVRDGGMAEVTVRSVPFALASATLDAPAAAALDAYLAAVATDCFLFAQAVGHVRPGAEGDGDTLTAHRLARTRADTVTAAMLKAGLPADSVTGLWDRQFAVREPRVTLWVFARSAGDDCAGTALPGALAQVAVVPAQAASAPTRQAAAAQAGTEPAPGIHIPESSPTPRRPAGVSPMRLSLAPPAARTSAQGGEVDEMRADAVHAAARAAIAPFERSPVMRMAVPSPSGEAATREATSAVGGPEQVAWLTLPVAVAGTANSPIALAALSTTADAEPKAGSSAALALAAKALEITVPRVEIVFEPDSSYLAKGAAAQLERLLASLTRDAIWEVELQAAVDDAAGSLPHDKALAYNQWLAERRQSRVEDRLGTRPGGPVLRVRRSVLPHDPSRRVVIRARPLP